MSRLAVLASGNGTNFEAIVRALAARPASEGPRHECVLLLYDRKAAFAAERARKLGIPARYVPYFQREPAEAEAEISASLAAAAADAAALAGFMRILSPGFVTQWAGRLVNVHPSLLPKWRGAHAIERAYDAGERRFGATVHFVDDGMDTGVIIAQESFERLPGESLEAVETRVHEVEHRIYPQAVAALLDGVGAGGAKR